MSKLVAALIISFGSVAAVQAEPTCWPWLQLWGHCGNPGHGGKPAQAPEIDPASAMGGLTLLVGGLAVLRGRSKKKQ
jgi:hypothetical protein